MAVTITLNPRFKKLNGGGVDLLHKQNTPNRERRAICDVVVDGSQSYTTGGIQLDFSVIRKFKEVYGCNIIGGISANTYTGIFAPGAGNENAGTGTLKLYVNTDATAANLGIEVGNAVTLTNFTAIVEIYGI